MLPGVWVNIRPLHGFEWGVGDCFGRALARASVKQKIKKLDKTDIRLGTDLEV